MGQAFWRSAGWQPRALPRNVDGYFDVSRQKGEELMQIWIEAARPRTLALAVASILLGTLLAAAAETFNLLIAGLAIVTATLLQILSNLANDYGDSVHGADQAGREGPRRVVASGQVSPQEMRRAILLCSALTATSGGLLVWLAFGAGGLLAGLIFVALGALAIWTAISYTAGNVHYGYAGLGDLAVLIFFGWVGAGGSYYLQTLSLDALIMLPATSCGLFAVGVLNINNIRDMESDQRAGKRSIPVRLGLRRARWYHWCLIVVGFLAALLYVVLDYSSPWQFLFLLTLPILLQNGRAVSQLPPRDLDPYLKQMSLATLLFSVTFGLGQVLG
jgi:1,4-dihydroxy-2-naphthoate octaprenyltransferase